MARIPNNELDRLKREVALVRPIKTCGTASVPVVKAVM